MVSGPECDVRPRRCLQVACVGLLSIHVCSLCSDEEAQVQDVDTRSGYGRGWVRREEGGQVMGYRIDGRTEAAGLKTPAHTIHKR